MQYCSLCIPGNGLENEPWLCRAISKYTEIVSNAGLLLLLFTLNNWRELVPISHQALPRNKGRPEKLSLQDLSTWMDENWLKRTFARE